jgi:diguanylate cyclase (GGDEF)-like protein
MGPLAGGNGELESQLEGERMAIAATPIIHSKGLLDLLRQSVPLQEQAVELYRRLLAINHLSGSMNSARDVAGLRGVLASYFQAYFPEDPVRLCFIDGSKYNRVRLSGPRIPKGEDSVPLADGLTGALLRSATPLWIPDTHASRKMRKSSAIADAVLPRSLIILPFTAMRKTIGCLELMSDQPNRFDKLEYHLGLLVAAHLSSSLENVLTRQELATANARLRDHEMRLTQLNVKLQELAHTDEATGLFNKRRLFEQLEMEVARIRRYGEVLSCLMLDMDDFKQVNDLYGHQAGDKVLQQAGELLRHSLRVTDFVARYGGEEFTVLLPRTNRAGAARVAENLRSKFMAHSFETRNAQVHLTISIGVSCCSPFSCLDARQIISLADSALYQAKGNGKNQTSFADDMVPSLEESGIWQSVKRV